MRKLRAAALFVVSSFCLPFAAGCSADAEEPIVDADEAPLTEARTLARGVAHPSGIAVAGGFVYFGSNEFVASGDPELDQQFAYWTGKFSRVALTGGRPEIVAEIGPVTKVRIAANKIFYGTADGCWISAVGVGQTGSGEQVYSDANCEPEWGQGPKAFEVTSNKLVVVHEDGKVKRGSLAGASMQQIAEIKVGNHGNVVDQVALAGENVFVVTQQHLTDSHDQPVPQQLFRVAVASGTKSKILDFAKVPSNMKSDGANLYWSEEGTKVFVLKAGSSQPEKIAEGFGQIYDLAADGTHVYVADGKRDAMYVVANALTTPKRPKKLAVAKGLEDMIVQGDTLYFGTHVVENRRVAGIIGSVKIPAL